LDLILDIFNQTAIEVCEGQQLDINFENQDNVSIDEYLEMIRLKTAVLLGCSTKIGAIIAGAEEQEANLIWQYGIDLGIAFQLKDDLLDAFGDEKVFGKKRGGDIATNKKTFLYLKALEEAGAETREELLDLYSHQDIDENEKINRVVTIFEALKVDQHTEHLINKYYERAGRALEEIPVPTEAKAELAAFASSLMKRER
jgi:geranylgeranyl diphosphate synthase type II